MHQVWKMCFCMHQSCRKGSSNNPESNNMSTLKQLQTLSSRHSYILYYISVFQSCNVLIFKSCSTHTTKHTKSFTHNLKQTPAINAFQFERSMQVSVHSFFIHIKYLICLLKIKINVIFWYFMI